METLAKKIFPNTMIELAEKDEKVVLLDADLGKAAGSDTFGKAFPERHIELGIAEQDMIGTAAGLSEMGFIPFATTFSCFATQRACDQVVNVCYNEFNVKIVGTYAGFSSEKNGGTHISVEDLAITRCLPNMTVLSPGDGSELEEILKCAYEIKGPVYIRMAKGPFKPLNMEGSFKLGKARTLRKGTDIAFIATGISTAECVEAAEVLATKGISATVLHMPSIKPVDKDAVIDIAKTKMPIYTVEDHSIYGGLGSLVSEITAENCPAKVTRIGMHDQFGDTAVLQWLLDRHGVSSAKIVERILQDYGK